MRFASLLPFAAALALVAAACGGDGDDGTLAWSAQAVTESTQDAPLQPVLVRSALGLGTSRLAFGLFDNEGALVSDAEAVSLRLYVLDGDEGALVAEHELAPVSLEQSNVHTHADGAQHTHGGPTSTVFVARAELGNTGWWGAEIAATFDGERVEGLLLRFFVSERTPEPAIGEPVPRSTQRVLRDVEDISEIDTSNPPTPAMHEFTVAEALDGGRPLVIAFATPAFCQTRFCGPVIDQVMRPLWERYGERAAFLHIEPWDVAEARAGRLVPVPQMAEWGLLTEPWVFVVDASGNVAAKFEGITSFDEVESALLAPGGLGGG